MKIIIVEDNNMQLENISEGLKREFPDVSILEIRTELEFNNKLNELIKNPPDLFIIDVMLRYTDLGRDMVLPTDKEIIKDGLYTAGFRCLRKLRKNKSVSDTPKIILSVIEKESHIENIEDFRENEYYMVKGGNQSHLMKLIRKLTKK